VDSERTMIIAMARLRSTGFGCRSGFRYSSRPIN